MTYDAPASFYDYQKPAPTAQYAQAQRPLSTDLTFDQFVEQNKNQKTQKTQKRNLEVASSRLEQVDNQIDKVLRNVKAISENFGMGVNVYFDNQAQERVFTNRLIEKYREADLTSVMSVNGTGRLCNGPATKTMCVYNGSFYISFGELARMSPQQIASKPSLLGVQNINGYEGDSRQGRRRNRELQNLESQVNQAPEVAPEKLLIIRQAVAYYVKNGYKVYVYFEDTKNRYENVNNMRDLLNEMRYSRNSDRDYRLRQRVAVVDDNNFYGRLSNSKNRNLILEDYDPKIVVINANYGQFKKVGADE
jgi:hypothetical protein